jgi:hypothetical protein
VPSMSAEIITRMPASSMRDRRWTTGIDGVSPVSE